MKRILSVLLLSAVAFNANAGFISGLIVGSMISGGGSSVPPQSIFVSSDKHDTIVCEAATSDLTKCFIDFETILTPAQYAYKAGFKVLYRQGVAISGNHTYIVMEVSK